jgi:two-component sensor histidine kinase
VAAAHIHRRHARFLLLQHRDDLLFAEPAALDSVRLPCLGLYSSSATFQGSTSRPEHLRQAIDAVSVALWSWNVDNDPLTMDQRAFDFWGLPWADAVSFEELSEHIHPADRNPVRAAFTATRSVPGLYISLRSANGVEDMAKDLIQRLTALGRAHDLLRPLPGTEGKAALLGDLLSILLEPYEDCGAFAGRIRVAVPRMGTGEGTATTLAAVIHELATNSVKHGALSVPDGILDVSGSCDETHLSLVWAEDGGPPVVGMPEMRGFGSKMIASSMSQQFDGALTYDWQPSGLVVTLRMRKDRLAKRGLRPGRQRSPSGLHARRFCPCSSFWTHEYLYHER